MNPRLTDEQRRALRAHPGMPVDVVDDETQDIYILVSKPDLNRMLDGRLRGQLQVGFDQADAGHVADWDVEEILAEAHRRHASRTT